MVCRKSASLALEKFTELAKRLSLIINHQKTRIMKLKEGFNFIGFYFVKRKSPTSGRNSIYVFPTK
ncbi:hypothetical protein [Cardinium endosymbiont of Oedothorax gibbosus]|uniref:hypothetical protein n=1 Tax=Cardinium endosymbiont of Oedothorax gibbosus TaxID=931101 RepID=UPI0020247EDF|nr:hypothetical protein [Cardinium endosymbiont of Oedothorax gibbosus]